MHQTKLIQIFSRFDKSEVTQFETFLESPFFNTSAKLLSLYRLLMPYYPGFDSPKLDKEKIYKKLHPKSGYNDQTMRDLISALFKLAREFISLRHFMQNPIEASNNRFAWLDQRGLIKMSEQELMHSRDLLNNYKQRDNNYYYQHWMADRNEYHHQADTLYNQEYKLIKNHDLEHHLHSLNKYYLLSFFQEYTHLLDLTQRHKMRVDPSLMAPVFILADRYTGQGDLMIDIYYNIYKLMSSSEERCYYELKSVFLAASDAIPPLMKTNLSIILYNYCIQKIHEGEQGFKEEVMEIIHFAVAHELMIEKGEIPYSYYTNVMIMGIGNGEMEWVNGFIEKYKSFLPAEFREDAYSYCQAYILLENKKYEEALRKIMTLNPFHEFTKTAIKNHTARIHYELGMFEQLNILLNTYPYHLSRETITSARKEIYTLFFTTMKQMTDLNQQYSADGWNELMERIDQPHALPHKTWFIEKMTEMKRKHKRT